MTKDKIEEKLKEIISEQLGVSEDEITNGSFFKALGGDSLDVVEIVMACEEEFDIELDDGLSDDTELTFSQLVTFIEEKAKD